MMQYLWAWRASRGKSSLMRMPATLVAIGRSSPRISAGASGLRSQVSSCGGPPVRNNSTQRFALPKPVEFAVVEGAAEMELAIDSPRLPSAPTRRKSRRVVPSQSPVDAALMSNTVSPEINLEGGRAGGILERSGLG